MLYPFILALPFFCSLGDCNDQVEIAKTHILNQDQLAGYIVFSHALNDSVQKQLPKFPNKAELECFDEIYTLYLKELGQGVLFNDTVLTACKEHPNWKSLLFFKAALMANQGDSIAFFDTFWQAYTSFPSMPIAYKIRGSVVHKVYEMSSDPDMRETARKQSLEFFIQAFTSSPEDLSLINRIILLSRPEDQKVVLSKLLPVLSSVVEPPSRTQCFMFLEIVQQIGSRPELEQLHGVVRRWFPVSRFLDEWEKINGFQKEALSTDDANG